jgi:hypothetical protein
VNKLEQEDIIRPLLIKGWVLTIDPYSAGMPESPDEFIAKYGGSTDEIAIPAKHWLGTTLYRSSVAPNDEKYGSFFSDFTSIASEVGIKVYATFSVFPDRYFAQDPRYTSVKSGGLDVKEFVCPSQTAYWKHIVSAAREVVRHPIKGIVLMKPMYPRREFCFCKRCRREFAELAGIEFDFVLESLMRDPELYEKFLTWRAEKISTVLSEIVTAVKEEKSDIETIATVDFDSKTNFLEGTREHFGQNIPKLTEITGHLLIHLMPFDPMYPEEGSATYRKVVAQMGFAEQLQRTGKKISLYIWGVKQSTDEELFSIEQLARKIGCEKIFAQADIPAVYREWREIQSGI